MVRVGTQTKPKWDAPDDIAQARVLVLSDGRPGGDSRSIGVAEMLGIKEPEVQTFWAKYTTRWLRWLPVRYLFEAYPTLEAEVLAGRYDALIGAGAQMSRIMRALKKVRPELFIVSLMRPAGNMADFDAIAVEEHDGVNARGRKRDNVVVTLGAPNRVTRDKLALEADRWRKRLQSVQGYKMAVVIGGTNRHGEFDAAEGVKLIANVTKAMKDKGGLLVTTSRRTGKAVTVALEQALANGGVPYYFWSPETSTNRDNPYNAYLALADVVLVTADSVSMVSEAATAGKPVLLWGEASKVPAKFAAFCAALIKQGRAKWWDGEVRMRPPAAPLLDTLMVAGFVRARWQKRLRGEI